MYDKYLVHIKHFSLFTEYRNILGMQHLAPFWHFKLNKFIPVYSNTFFIGSYQIGTLAFKYKFIIPLHKQYIIVPLIAILKYIFTINAQVYNKLHIVRKIVKKDVSSCSTGCTVIPLWFIKQTSIQKPSSQIY